MNKQKKHTGVLSAVLVIAAMIIGIFIGILIGRSMGQENGNLPDETMGVETVDESQKASIPEESKESDASETEETVSETLESGSSTENGAVVLKVNDQSVTMEEMNYYLYSVRDYYVSVYGEEPWDKVLEDGVTVAEQAKEQLLKDTIETLLLVDHADEYGIEFSAEMRAQMADSAQEYVNNLGADICEQFGLKASAIAGVFAAGELRNQVYLEVMAQIDEDIRSDAGNSGLSGEELEKLAMDKYNELLEQWKSEADIETTQIWDSIVVGSVG